MVFRISTLLGMIACAGVLHGAPPAGADSLSLLTDLEYEVNSSATTDKHTGIRSEDERTTFSQLYSLDIRKELTPNLMLNFGGLFEQDDIDNDTTDPTGRDSDERNSALRPYLDLQLDTPFWRAATGYRKSEVKRVSSIAETQRNFTEEYSARLNWEPVDWPEVDFDFTRTLAYNQPKTNDQQVDTYQLRSRYNYENFRFTYNHTTNEALNRLTDFETLTDIDEGSIRFSRSYRQGTVALNSSLRGRRQAITFDGEGDRLVPTNSAGAVIGSSDDPAPATSDPQEGFSLNQVDLLVDSLPQANQLSFGLDFGAPTDVDRLLIDFTDIGNHHSGEFPWRIYVRDNDAENWRPVLAVQDLTNLAENRFELAFPSVSTRFIKIVTTPLAPPAVPAGEDLLINEVEARRTLPADTSEFESTDWTGDLSVNWKHTEDTSTGYDLLYREQRSQPLDEKRTQLNAGLRLRHRFDDTFTGNMRLQRAERRDRGEGSLVDYSYSAALTARYLETFNQTLTYSFNHQDETDVGVSTANAFLLRSNLDLYQGWSLYLDNGYSWQDPAEDNKTSTTFVRVGSNIVPNRWLNLTLTYGVSWIRETGEPTSRDQDGRLVVTWVPTAAFSLSADLSFTDETGEDKEASTEQRYFINWTPFRDGTLHLSVGYGRFDDTDNAEQGWSFTPTLRWQINPKTLLTLEYALGEQEDRNEAVDFENISLGLRFFY